MTFDSGMVLVGDREALDKRVDIPKEPSASTAAGATADKPEPVKLYDTVRSVLTGR